MRSGSRIGGRDELGTGRRREASGCQQALMVNRCGGTPSLLLCLEPCTHTHTHVPTHTYCNTQSGEGKAKQPFGVNSWDGRDGCGRLYAERPNWEKTISVIETGRVNMAVCGSFILRCGSAGMPVSSDPRISQRSGPHNLIYLRPVQDRALYLTARQT